MLAGRYRLGTRLGRGGMGTVWHAVDEMLDREVAVKELSVGHLAEEDLQIVQSRMKQEARAAARIRHPGVITIHDVLEQDGKPWIVMELISGRSLAELVEQEGTLNPREAAGIGAQVLAALHRGHLVGVIHRDVKPANVLLEQGTGRVVLTDFGIATYEGDSALTRTGDLIGSPDYLAPERVHGSRPGPSSDLWGLGATLFAAVEGESPFRRDSPLTTLTAVVTDPLPEPRNAGALTPVLQALLSKDPDERPSAPEAIRMLQRVAAGDTTTIGQPPSPLRTPTSTVPLVDRNEHTPAPAVRTEPTRPALVESEYRTEPVRAVSQQPTLEQPAGPQHQQPHQHPYQQSQQNEQSYQRPQPRRRRRRLWPWLVVAALLAALAGGGVAYDYTIMRHRSASGGGTPRPGGSPSASASPSAPVVPAGFVLTKDPDGFSFPLPITSPPFQRVAGSTLTTTDYSPESDEDHLIRFGVTAGQNLTPIQHLLQMKQSVKDKTFVVQDSGQDVFHGYPGARWDWTYVKLLPDGSQEEHHAIEQLYKDGTGTEYDIMVDYPADQWTTCYERFLAVLNGFSTP
ncbi:serine/threonine protein kinase [Streptacidiphilus sp. PB12-B1b]|nr:serine/threonine protein kinase [Streptacidiphilus sp. PB12-B1b]